MNKDTTILLNELASCLLTQAAKYNEDALSCAEQDAGIIFATAAVTLMGLSKAINKTIINLQK